VVPIFRCCCSRNNTGMYPSFPLPPEGAHDPLDEILYHYD
jgi:hypothetical protein